jgi:hypothetical protein
VDVVTEHPRWPTAEDFAEASAERRAMDHRFDVDTDRCRCGGLIVSDADGQFGEGCEVSGRVCVSPPLLDVDSPDYGRPETGRWDGEDHG